MATDTQFAGKARNVVRMPRAITRTPADLAKIVARFAASEKWIERVRFRVDQRWYERLYDGPDYDVWVISWLPGQSTGFHDHGESAGAFIVATGVLEEHRPDGRVHVARAGDPRAFGAEYAHDVRNVSVGPAVSIHAYSPPITEMNEYEVDGGRLVPRDAASEGTTTARQPDGRKQRRKLAKRGDVSRVDQVLADARARLRRLSPDHAFEAVTKSKAVLVDIRPAEQRAIEGDIAGALVVERNVLEWRLDPTSDTRLPVAMDHDLQVIVFCSEGYTSSLAAAALQDLGLWRATDIVGGFQAWRAAGLPTAAPRRHLGRT